jgi:hypothetical protein
MGQGQVKANTLADGVRLERRGGHKRDTQQQNMGGATRGKVIACMI